MADKPHKPKPPVSPSSQVTAMQPGDLAPPAPAARPQQAVPLGSMLGKYKVLAALGRGGMGTVYAAEDTLIKRKVAIKVLPPELARDPALINRLLAEAQAAGRLNHPNVVTIYDVHSESGNYYIVMELVPAGSVQEYLATRGSPGWRAATRLIAEACKALSAAHETGLIHRDIKPSNLMLTQDGHVKVADFGLAKAETSDMTMATQPGAILGTPAFMSPEQCRGDKLDARTDLYSLGCTYYAMLTGKPPFEAATSMQVMFAHCSAPIPDPRDLAADVPDDCVQILTRALAKSPADRYASAKEMLADLRAALGGQTLSHAPISALAEAAQAEPLAVDYQTPEARKPMSPKWWLIGGAAAVILLAGAAVMFLSVSYQTVVVSPSAVVPPATYKLPGTVAPTPLPNPSAASPVTPDAPTESPLAPVTQPAGANYVGLVPLPAAEAIAKPIESHPVATAGGATEPKIEPKPEPLPAKVLPPELTNSIKLKMVLLKPGHFMMGDEKLPDAPPHEVAISKPFYMGVYEVTQGELLKVVPRDHEDGPTPPGETPASFVTYERAVDFCRRLSDLPEEKAAGRTYRLPTEAEWEYACRAGTTTKYAFGNTLTADQANFGKKIDLTTLRKNEEQRQPGDRNGPPSEHDDRPTPPANRGDRPDPSNNGNGPRGQGQRGGQPGNGQPPQDRNAQQRPLERVGRYTPNGWGLADMHGSVWEWCSDFYATDYYKTSPPTDPTGPENGALHVARGGAWNSPANLCTSAYRNGKAEAANHDPLWGFRVVCEVQP